jgi:NADH dehydrogenase FAD-containing subunit
MLSSTGKCLCAQHLTTGLRLMSGTPGGGKDRIVILGVGWGGYRLARDLDKSMFDVTVISPRNHFLFTPLLPSTTVGTLEFRYMLIEHLKCYQGRDSPIFKNDS